MPDGGQPRVLELRHPPANGGSHQRPHGQGLPMPPAARPRRPAVGLFDHDMSTRTVLEDTLANATALGLSAHVQQPSFDIDTAEDLVRLDLTVR